MGTRYLTIYVLRRNKKNNVYSCKPQFYYIKVGFKEVKIIQTCSRDETLEHHCIYQLPPAVFYGFSLDVRVSVRRTSVRPFFVSE